MSESLDEECKRIDRFVATMHAESMARNEQRRLTLYTQQPSAEYERTALELWAEGATEYARRILRRERLLGVSAAEEVRRAWYALGTLHRLVIGLTPHRATHRHIAKMICDLVSDCETAERST